MVKEEIIDYWGERIFKYLVAAKGKKIDEALETIKPLFKVEELNEIREKLNEKIVLRRITG